MEVNGSYYTIIAISIIIIVSYLFNILSRRTNIPSVILLISLGVLIREGLDFLTIGVGDTLLNVLEILGIVGLIMIVLEAALDLELTHERWPIIWKSLVVAFLALVFTSGICAFTLHYLMEMPPFRALLYAVPLSIMSSAIIIPSVGGLIKIKKEFMVYESTFSDILGIMFFYFLLGNSDAESATPVVFSVLVNIIITIVLSVGISYALVFLFQKLNTQVKLFLLIAVLCLLYSIGKLFHLSSLMIILIFGLILNNYKLFFRGKLQPYLEEEKLQNILHNFHLVTIESAFVVRTFFFVIFGITIEIGSLIDLSAALVSLVILAIIYLVRLVVLYVTVRKDLLPQLFIAPRGLITILLFFSIPTEFTSTLFNPAILLYTILLSSVVMTVALVASGKNIEPVDEISFHYWEEVDRQIIGYARQNEEKRVVRKEEIVTPPKEEVEVELPEKDPGPEKGSNED